MKYYDVTYVNFVHLFYVSMVIVLSFVNDVDCNPKKYHHQQQDNNNNNNDDVNVNVR